MTEESAFIEIAELQKELKEIVTQKADSTRRKALTRFGVVLQGVSECFPLEYRGFYIAQRYRFGLGSG